jgi:hypothetical protein
LSLLQDLTVESAVGSKLSDVDGEFFDIDRAEKANEHVIVVETKFSDVDGVDKVCDISFNYALKGAIPCKIFRLH